MNSKSITEIPTKADDTIREMTNVQIKKSTPMTHNHCHVRSFETNATNEIVIKKLIATTQRNKIG